MQSATSPARSAAIGYSCQFGDGRPAAAAHRFGSRDPTCDGGVGIAAGTGFERHNRSSFFVQAFGCRDRGGPGSEDTGTGQSDVREDETTVVKPPATEKTEPPPALMVQNGSSRQPKPEPEAQEAEQAPAATSIATGTSTERSVWHCRYDRDQCSESAPGNPKNFAGCFAGTDRKESPACLSSASPADSSGRHGRTAGEHFQVGQHLQRQTAEWRPGLGACGHGRGAAVEIQTVLPEWRASRS